MARETGKEEKYQQQIENFSDEDAPAVGPHLEKAKHDSKVGKASNLSREEDRVHDYFIEEECDETDSEKEKDNEDETMSREQAFKKLEHLCRVLGLNYRKKLDEFGAGEIKTEDVLDMVYILNRTSCGNFKALKRTATELLHEWKLSDTPSKKTGKFSWILPILDANSSNDLTQEGVLSTEGAIKAVNEVKLLRKERAQKRKTRYTYQKKKLERVLSETHIRPEVVGFDPSKQVTEGNYISEKKEIKKIIEKVKVMSQERKEVILRVETLKSAIKKKVTTEEVEAMIQKIQMVAKDIAGGEMVYDNQTLDDYICNLFAFSGKEGTNDPEEMSPSHLHDLL